MSSYILGVISGSKTESMRDFYLCYPAILTNTLVPQLGLSSILQNQLGVALDALTPNNNPTRMKRCPSPSPNRVKTQRDAGFGASLPS